MTRPRVTVKTMRWAALVLVTLMVSSASARRRAPSAPKRIAKKHQIVALAKTAVPESEATKAEPNKFTNDPVLAGAERIVGRDRDGYVAFTFDDGPNPGTTPAVIEALKKYDIPATFFIVTRHITTSEDAAQSRELLAKEIEHGFTIGNHTAHHANLRKADDKKLFTEMDEAFATLSTEAKRPIGLFRAPYGNLGAKGRAHLEHLGATEVYWSIDTRDWQTKEKDAAKLRKKILKLILAENGGVVLMHDTRKITAQIIGDVFDDLEAENCRRLTAKEDPIWPVSLHYFLREHDKSPRGIPDDVAKRTAAYKAALPGRCAARSQPPAVAPATK